MRERRKKNPEKAREAVARYRAKPGNKEKIRRARRKYMKDPAVRKKYARAAKKANLKKNYGLDIEEYHQMIEAQKGLCAICGDVMEQPHVDHDHDTGIVRAILCSLCNLGLGAFKDDTGRMDKAIEYLREHSL